jgi:hypothetical protein
VHARTRRVFLSSASILALLSCKPDEPEIVGAWRNDTQQLLVIEPNLTGKLLQERMCAPPLVVSIHRDPFDAYAIRFDPNQLVYFPLVQKELFAPSEYFCASKDSVPMCQFCRVEDKTMSCTTTEQKITGRGATVVHNCNWRRVETTTATISDMCPPPVDGGAGCRAGASPIDGGEDAGDLDAGVTD